VILLMVSVIFWSLVVATITGGYLIFPEYRIAVNVRPGDLLLVSNHEIIHGNTEIKLTRPDADTSNLPQLPNVVGLTESEARELLQNFTITIERAPNARIPKDRVAAQLPVATSRVTSGSSITLTLSDGRGESIVPTDIIGKSLEEDASVA